MSNNQKEQEVVTVIDRLIPEDARLRGWLANGEALKTLKFGRRAILAASPGEAVIVAALPLGLASDGWVAWYEGHPGCLPQTWQVGVSGRAVQIGTPVTSAVALAAGEQVSASWRAAGAAVEGPEAVEAPIVINSPATESEPSQKAEIIVLTSKGQSEPTDEQAVLQDVSSEAAEKPVVTQAIKEVAETPVIIEAPTENKKEGGNNDNSTDRKITLARPTFAGGRWEMAVITGGPTMQSADGEVKIEGGAGDSVLLVKVLENSVSGKGGLEASAWKIDGEEWSEDHSLFMAASIKPGRFASISEAARQIISDQRARKVEGFRQFSVSSAALRGEVVRTGELPAGLIGADNLCFAPLVSWEGEGEIQLRILSTDSNISQAVAVKNKKSTTLYAPVEAAYSVHLTLGKEQGLETSVSLYGDGTVRALSTKQALKIKEEGRDLKVLNLVLAKEAEVRKEAGPTPGDQGMGGEEAERGPAPAPGEYETYEGEMGDGPAWGEGDEELGRFDEESYSMSAEEQNFDSADWGGAAGHGGEPPEESGKKERVKKGQAERTEDGSAGVGPGRNIHQGPIQISAWSRIVPRGWIWITELIYAAVDSAEELQALGCQTELQLVCKGFPFSGNDKLVIDAVLKGPLKGRLENIRIYSVDNKDYFVRPTGEGFRIIGPKGKIATGKLAHKLEEAYAKDPVVLSSGLLAKPKSR